MALDGPQGSRTSGLAPSGDVSGSAGEASGAAKDPRSLRSMQLLIRLLIVGTAVAIALLAWLNRSQLADAQRSIDVLGYPAIFLLSIIGSGTMFLPLPSVGATFFGGMALSPVVVGLVAGAGEALGEMVGYGVGYSGQGLLEGRRIRRRVYEAVRRRGGLAVFLAAIVPNPFFDVVGLAAGVLRYPVVAFLAYAWAGKTIKSIGIAFAGHYGAEWLSRLPWFGIG